MSDEEEDVKAKMLGRFAPAFGAGGHKPDPDRLYRAFERPRSVARMFCGGCGRDVELSREMMESFGEEYAEIEEPRSLIGYYFQVDGCFTCCSRLQNVRLEKIPTH